MSSSPIIVPKQNIGESDEIRIKKYLFINQSNIAFLLPIFGDMASEGITMPYSTIEQIKKAGTRSKCDLEIVFNKTGQTFYVSIKSIKGQKPSILNHTPRSAKVFQTGELTVTLPYIDILLMEYIDKRKKGTIGEDVFIHRLDSFNNTDVKNSVIKILIYFIFKGTGSKLSPKECNSMIIGNKDDSLTFIPCVTEEEKVAYINTMIEKCVISLRPKGMPKQTNEQCKPWVYTDEAGRDRGSIHIRVDL
jgi:hypothetical protein